jgi:hypothetical protein
VATENATAAVFRTDNTLAVLGSSTGNLGPRVSVAQMKTTGELDSFWGSNGTAAFTVGLGPVIRASSIAEQKTKKLVAFGASTDVNGAAVLTRVLANGSAYDTGFGQNGISQRMSGIPIDMTLDDTDRPLSLTVDGNTWLVHRATADGAPDLTFGTAGRVVGPMPSNVTSIAVQSDGRILVLGWFGDPFNPPEQAFIVRLWN